LTLRRYAKVVQLALPNDNLTKDANDFLCKILLSLQRNYDVSLPHNKIPDLLSALAKKMAIPAMPSGEEFKPEAAIVNYYGPSDMLGGHVDDMEADWSKPIVSISLGCKCIFLLGGKTRDEVPTAMFLRSGDIVLMAGEARECFHGNAFY
jgi:alkylated DNA repair protein alkB family protein 1